MVWAGFGALRRYTVGINGDNAMDMFTERAWNPVLGFWPTTNETVDTDRLDTLIEGSCREAANQIHNALNLA